MDIGTTLIRFQITLLPLSIAENGKEFITSRKKQAKNGRPCNSSPALGAYIEEPPEKPDLPGKTSRWIG